MRKLLLGLLAFVCIPAFASVDGEYEKRDGVLSIKENKGGVSFSLNSSVEDHSCLIEGNARVVDAHRAAYTSEDPADQCVVVFSFVGGGVKVTTGSCGGYCGMNAEGSMDGVYKKAKN